MNFKNMKYDEFNQISFKRFKDNFEIDWEKHCYNPESHNCTGGCQGASDCLLAQHYRGELKERPTKEEMIERVYRQEYSSISFDKFMETDEGKEITRQLKEDIKKYLGG